MPWDASSFREKHNKKLKGHAAEVAAKVATGLVNKGMPEGQAIRIANAQGDKAMSKADHRYRKRG